MTMHTDPAPAFAPSLAEAAARGQAGTRLWLYATYHCNLACTYCLTESHPRIADRRTLPPAHLVAAAEQACEHGFDSVGITGGEVFVLRDFAGTLGAIASVLPTLVLTNGTLLTPRLLDRLAPLAGAAVAFQLSLDSASPTGHDALRGPNHARVVEAIRALRAAGHHVRIATTVTTQDAGELEHLCELHRELGIPDGDHVVRTVVRRGLAAGSELGVELGPDDVLPELTLTTEGAFLHPFGPTVRGGVTDLDLRVHREPLPLAPALEAFLAACARRPAGDDVVRNVR